MLRIGFAILAAAWLAGCVSTTNSDLSVTDRGTVIPSVRASVDIAPRIQAPAIPHSGHSIEFAISGTSGDDVQGLAATDPQVVFGGQTFAAPNSLHHEFDFGFVELAYRFRHFFGDGSFGIEALGGLGFAEFNLTTTSATRRAQEKLSNGGLLAGFGVIWKFLPSTSLQSRLTVFGSGEREDVTGAARFDLYVAQRLGRHVALRGGVVGWGITSTREASENFISPNSRIRARFSGLGLGLDVMF